MKKKKCTTYGFVYDEAEGLPDNWICPDCGVGKEVFLEIVS